MNAKIAWENPQDTDLLQVYGDYLEEQGDEKHLLYHWLGETKRKPIVGPLNYHFWFKEGECSLVNSTLPVKIFKNLSKDGVWFYTDPEEGEKQLFSAYKYATSNGWLGKWVATYPQQWVNPEVKNLNICMTETKSDGYSSRTYLTPATLDDILDKTIHGTTIYLFIKMLIGNMHIATCDVDIDNGDTRNWAERNNIGYLEIESSPGRRWFVLDLLTQNIKSSGRILQNLNDNDVNYSRICGERGNYVLRGEMRKNASNYIIPKIIKSTLKSGNLDSWVKKWLTYWADPRLQEICRHR